MVGPFLDRPGSVARMGLLGPLAGRPPTVPGRPPVLVVTFVVIFGMGERVG